MSIYGLTAVGVTIKKQNTGKLNISQVKKAYSISI